MTSNTEPSCTHVPISLGSACMPLHWNQSDPSQKVLRPASCLQVIEYPLPFYLLIVRWTRERRGHDNQSFVNKFVRKLEPIYQIQVRYKQVRSISLLSHDLHQRVPRRLPEKCQLG